MTEFSSYPPGTFCWVDLAANDAAAAKAFYTRLFGWEAEDRPMGPDTVYTMLSRSGKNVAGLYQQDPVQQAQGMPPRWSSYVSVADAEAVAGRVEALGGKVVMPPTDVMEEGRMALLQDPEGAMLGLWQSGNHIGADVCNEPGSLSWNELSTRNPQQAARFYSGLFGWNVQPNDMGSYIYTTFAVGERMNAGMIEMTPEWGDLPPHWTVYFAVEDCDASAQKAEALGGKIEVPPTDIPPVGRMSVIIDPQGAVFIVIKVDNPD